MTLSLHGIAYALIFLAIGLAEVFVYERAVHPVLSHRHETAKVTYSQGRSPVLISNLIRLQALVVLPLLGYLLGSQFLSPGAH
ncbi:MAG: hypothetical protein JNM45_16870 [Rhizobiales bacterium]|nr:hypothetical protein [Hyphomicrobiales bacterium]